MAIMRRCCCFDNVRSGSKAAGIYTLIYNILSMAATAYQIPIYSELPVHVVGLTRIVTIVYSVSLGFLSLLVISSILLLVGIAKDKRSLLLPYMVMKPLLILLQIVSCIFIIYSMSVGAYSQVPMIGGNNNHFTGLLLTIMIPFLITVVGLIVLNVFCFLCVVSQYTELRDGRGRLQDVMAAKLLKVGYAQPQELQQLQPYTDDDYPVKDPPPAYEEVDKV